MVNVSISLKSFRCWISSSVIEVGILLAAFSISFGNAAGKPYSNRMVCISVLRSPGLPRLLIILPCGDDALLGQSINSTSTLSPSTYSFNSSLDIKKSVYI